MIQDIKRPPEVLIGIHFCRGNKRSAWGAEGSYEPIAEKAFSSLKMDRYLMEFDTERAGGFEPLRFVPKGKTIVLGLITTKEPQLEPEDELLRRIEQASSMCRRKTSPLARNAASPPQLREISFLGTTCAASSSWSPRSREGSGVAESVSTPD
jgi:5-methyltetrahydropteroyltriglutamate--homocysteine methyltransferase